MNQNVAANASTLTGPDPSIVRLAKNALNHLHDFISEQRDVDHGLMSIIELASRGLEHVSEHECAFIDDVEIAVRVAVSHLIKEKIARKGKEKAA